MRKEIVPFYIGLIIAALASFTCFTTCLHSEICLRLNRTFFITTPNYSVDGNTKRSIIKFGTVNSKI